MNAGKPGEIKIAIPSEAVFCGRLLTAYFAACWGTGMFLRIAAGSLVVVVAGVLVAALFFALTLGAMPFNSTDCVLLLFYVGAGPFLLWGAFCLMMGLFLIAEGFLRCE